MNNKLWLLVVSYYRLSAHKHHKLWGLHRCLCVTSPSLQIKVVPPRCFPGEESLVQTESRTWSLSICSFPAVGLNLEAGLCTGPSGTHDATADTAGWAQFLSYHNLRKALQHWLLCAPWNQAFSPGWWCFSAFPKLHQRSSTPFLSSTF